jgi:hypothetical protein
MLVPSLITLAVAALAACLSLNTQEEIVKVAMAFTSVVGVLLTLMVAPWVIKLLLISIPFWFNLKTAMSSKSNY